MIAFRFTSLRTGGEQYEVQTAALSHMAPATKGEDATKIGIGAGAGAVIGGLLGGKDGAAKGAGFGGVCCAWSTAVKGASDVPFDGR